MDDFICPIMSKPIKRIPPGWGSDTVELYEVKCMKEKCSFWVKEHWICEGTPLAVKVEGCCGMISR